MSIITRFQNGWNAFIARDPTHIGYGYHELGSASSYRPDRVRLTRGNERSITTSVFNRIALDVSSVAIKHIRLDANDRYIETIDSGLNRIFNLEANIDQTGEAFVQDVVLSMLDEGCVAMVPIDTTIDPNLTCSYDINTMRAGKITQWYPQHVRVQVYNDRTGLKEELTLPKHYVGLIENPLYAVINETNSTHQRLVRKLSLLDVVDEQLSSGKLDMIVQLPYAVKHPTRKSQAEDRTKLIESQLKDSKYGIAYIDSSEKITQLNRPLENNLMSQVEYLTSMLYSQLGLTKEIMDGTASEEVMLNYFSRTIEPILSAIVNECKRKFLTPTARTQKQSIDFFRDAFRLVPVNKLSELVDKFTRNEIASSNEMRQVIGWKPSDDPKADELRNKNLSQAKQDVGGGSTSQYDFSPITGFEEDVGGFQNETM